MDEAQIELLAFVLSSKWRVKLITLLYNNIYTPYLITNLCKIYIYKVSRLLTELRDHGLAECINPTAKKGRMYKLTDRGEDIVKILNKIVKE